MFQTLYQRYVASTKSQELILRLSILALVYIYAFSIRLVCDHSSRHDHRVYQSLKLVHSPASHSLVQQLELSSSSNRQPPVQT